MMYIFVVLAVLGLVAVDHQKGPIFPDEVYCMLGAGQEIRWNGRADTRVSSTRVGQPIFDPSTGNMIGRERDTPNGYTTTYTSGGSRCYHTTLWDGWDLMGDKKKAAQAAEVERVSRVTKQEADRDVYSKPARESLKNLIEKPSR